MVGMRETLLKDQEGFHILLELLINQELIRKLRLISANSARLKKTRRISLDCAKFLSISLGIVGFGKIGNSVPVAQVRV
ncbi:hypothetical protein VNO77_22833 [Canavalia gladiata]|uniref:Uncharacterized protein n=1 Tax=Canavalia gladiata TaxID=3824 RepID=A0AAN9QAY5_CANGL